MTLARIILVLSFALSGCASLNARLPDIERAAVNSEQSTQMQNALERYREVNDRLQSIAHTVLAANAALCDKTRADIGLHTARRKDMPKALRKTAQDRWGLDDKPRIIYADANPEGVLGDYIMHDGKAVDVMQQDFDPRHAVMTAGGLAVKRTAHPVCHYPVRLRFSPVINAYANGRQIVVTTGMMDFTSDEELALIIGHELAHNTQGHIRKIIQNRILALGRANFTRKFESESDYIGLYYMARAGYDISGAAQFWRRLASVSIKSLDEASSHPITPERFVRLEAAIREIEMKRENVQPLVPNLNTDRDIKQNE